MKFLEVLCLWLNICVSLSCGREKIRFLKCCNQYIFDMGKLYVLLQVALVKNLVSQSTHFCYGQSMCFLKLHLWKNLYSQLLQSDTFLMWLNIYMLLQVAFLKKSGFTNAAINLCLLWLNCMCFFKGSTLEQKVLFK